MDILKHHAGIKRLVDAEHEIKEAWHMEHKFPGRVEPAFRRIRLHDDPEEKKEEATDSGGGAVDV